MPAAAGAEAADQEATDERVVAAPAAEPAPATRTAPRPARAAGKPAELEVAVYLSGSVEIAHGGVRLILQEPDVRRLMAFLTRCEVGA